MDRLEQIVIFASIGLVATFTGLLVFSLKFFGLNVPTCITDIAPFQTGSIKEMYDPVSHKNRFEVRLVAKMWVFDPPIINVVPDADIDIYVTSPDVVHGFHVSNTNANLMAVPGTVNFFRLRFDKPGTHTFLCHEYCGVGHQAMAGKIVVHPKGDFYRPKDESKITVASLNSVALEGKNLISELGCLACHSTDGSALLAPSFKGIFGRQQSFTDGTQLLSDQTYLTESILEPNKKLVKGFQALMPKMVTDSQQAEKIIDYLKTLK